MCYYIDMALRIKWDEYEEALLIHYYCMIQDGHISFDEAKSELSTRLRRKAERKGLVIDKIYRNENGMSMKLGNIQYLFTDGQKGLESYSKMDKKIFELYKNNKEKYQQLLNESLEITD